MTEKDLKLALKAVKAAKKLGVVSMKFGSLEFELAPYEGTRVGRTTSKMSAKKIAQAEEDVQAAFDFSEVSDGLSVMHVEDPLGFERGLIENLIDGDSGGIVEEKEGANIS